MTSMSWRTAVITAGVCLYGSVAAADPILFDSPGLWRSATTTARVENMEGIVPADQREFNLGTKTSWRDGPIYVHADNPMMEIIGISPRVPFPYAYPFSSDAIYFQGWPVPPVLNVDFARPSTAVAFQYWARSDAPTVEMTAELLGENGTYYYAMTSPLDTAGFFGITSEDPIHAMRLRLSSAGGMGIDNIAMARIAPTKPDAPVPEPASLLLLGSSAVGLLYRRHRNRRTAA